MQAVSVTVDDQPPIKTDPNQPVPLASWEEYKWRQEYTEQSKKLKLYNDSMPKAYIHLYNQCSTNLKNDLEESNAFPQVEASKDAIGLLKLIQGLCCSYGSKTQSVMATVASQKKFFTFFQRDGMDNSSYHREFVVHVETIETYGGMGAIGITPTFVAQKLHEMHAAKLCNDPVKPTETELAAAHKDVWDEFLAALMLISANRDCYGALCNELANQFGFGNDLYPKTTDQCLTMMNRRMDGAPRQPRAPHQSQGAQPIKADEEALVFAQGADKKTPGKQPKNDSSSKSSLSSISVSRGNKTPTIICKNCGKQGHISTVCPNKKRPDQIHAMATEQPDDASVSSEDASIFILAQVDDSIPVPPLVHLPVPPRTYADALLRNGISTHNGHSSTPDGAIFTQDATQVPCRPISSDLLLLDSQSTVHLFSQPDHVHNIRPAKNPIQVHCNKGTLEMTHEADYGATPVYFDSRGIANV